MYGNGHTILASWVGAIVDAVGDDGYAWQDLAPVARIGNPRLASSGMRVSQDIMRLVWDRAYQVTGDASVPLRAATRFQPHSLHLLGFCLQAAGSLDEVVRIVHRRFHVISTAAALRVDRSGSSYRITSVSEPAVNDEGFEMFMAFLLKVFTLLSPEPVVPRRIALRRNPGTRSALERFREYFGCTVEFGAADNAMEFNQTLMFAPLPSANSDIRIHSEKLLDDYLVSIGSRKFVTVVRSQILDLLKTDNVSEDAVAHRLNMSRSSLARRLREEGETYRNVFHATQCSLAMQYLRDEDLPISEIGFRLGFQDLSSFSRSFRRWSGESPREWRKRHFEQADS